MDDGMVHIYYGDGKGKTTAALGLALRAAGSGKNVLVVQFLKGGPSGEVSALAAVKGLSFLRAAPLTKFTWDMTKKEKTAACKNQVEMLAAAIEQAQSGACDVLVLDEALGAIATGLLDEKALLTFLRTRPAGLEVVLTGRDPSAQLLELADYATEMHKVKHPFDRGVSARKGVEY